MRQDQISKTRFIYRTSGTVSSIVTAALMEPEQALDEAEVPNTRKVNLSSPNPLPYADFMCVLREE